MAFTPVPTVVAGNKGTATWGNAVATAVTELQQASSAAGSVTANFAGGIAVTRVPLPAGNFLVRVRGSGTNAKGSNWASGDDLGTIPVGYRPAGLIVFIAFNYSTGVAIRLDALADGTIESQTTAVANGQGVAFETGWET